MRTLRPHHPVATLALAAALGAPFAGAALAQAAPTLTHSEVLTDLDEPWDMAFLPDGTMFFTEKCQGLSVRLPDGTVKPLLGMAESEGYPETAADLFCEGQAGMNGVAVDPAFAENRSVYVYSASNLTAPGTNRVLRLTVAEDFGTVADRTDIVADISYKPKETDQPFGGKGAHNGGRLRFDANGHLFVTTGDTHNPDVPQSPTALGGKVLRIDRDGQPVAENGAPEGFDPRIYTYGHRNVQGIAFIPGSGTPVTAEHGPWHSDEITVLRPGGNAGWDPRPNVAGRSDCPDGYCGYEPNQMDAMDPAERAEYMPMTDLEAYPDAMKPSWTNNGYSQGTSSAAFLEGEAWGAWNGKLVVGLMGIGFGGTELGQRIDVVDLPADGSPVASVEKMPLPMEGGRFRSLVLGPDGALYAAVDEGTIHRLAPN